jgi:hypothetical protein
LRAAGDKEATGSNATGFITMAKMNAKTLDTAIIDNLTSFFL